MLLWASAWPSRSPASTAQGEGLGAEARATRGRRRRCRRSRRAAPSTSRTVDRVVELRRRARLARSASPGRRRVEVAACDLAPRQAAQHAHEQHAAEALGVGQRLVEQRPLALAVALLGRDPAAEEQRRGPLLGRRRSRAAPRRRSGGRRRCRPAARRPRPSSISASTRRLLRRSLARARTPRRGCAGRPASCRRRATATAGPTQQLGGGRELAGQAQVQGDQAGVLGHPLAGVVGDPLGDEAVQALGDRAAAPSRRSTSRSSACLNVYSTASSNDDAVVAEHELAPAGHARATRASRRRLVATERVPRRRPRTPGRRPTTAAARPARRARGCRGGSAARRSTSPAPARRRGDRRGPATGPTARRSR